MVITTIYPENIRASTMVDTVANPSPLPWK